MKSSTKRVRNHLSWILASGAVALLLGPFFLWYRSSYPGTELILHPFDATKDVIQNKDYAIVFDGGSTGTRVHIFTFLIDDDRRQQKILLDSESFAHTKPGLSSYATNISGAADSLEPLLRHTFMHVPSRLAGNTPIILKATAGLRLLPHNSADLILDTVRSKFRSLPYSLQDDDAVGMLDEQDEGLFAWYTVNFLLGRLHNITSSGAALDLGGGSTQVTFSTNDINTLVTSPSDYIVKKSIEGQPEYIYTHSYLGNGLMSARAAILELGTVRQTTFHDKDSSATLEHRIDHPCFRSLNNNTHGWRFSGVHYWVKFEDHGPLSTFDACYELAQQFVEDSNIDRSEELARREVHLMSYFYDRMKDIKVVKHESGFVKVRDYFLYAEHVCDGTIRMKRQDPFLCLDLIYIASYLHDGLGLPLNKDVFLVKKFKGIEISWALGAAINLFHLS